VDSDEFCGFSPATIDSIDDEWMGGGGVGLTDGGMMLEGKRKPIFFFC